MIVYFANAEKFHLPMFVDIGAVPRVLISYFRTSPNQAQSMHATTRDLLKQKERGK